MTAMKSCAPAQAIIPARRQRGFSLVELMISIAIGMILLVGFITLIVQQSSTRDELEKSSRQIENGRYAMQLLHDDIEHAGFYGLYSPASGVVYTLPADPCVIAFGAAKSGWDNSPTSVPVPLYGYLGAGANPMAATTCGLTNYMPNTAILVVRRVVTTMITTASAVAATTYIQASGCNTDNRTFLYGPGTVSFPLRQKDCGTISLLSPYIVNVYYISTCDVCGTDTIPTLKMVQSGPDSTPAAPIPLVEGIENMQFDYGIDNTGDGAPDSFVAPPGIADLPDWQNVMSVRVSLLARNIDPTTGYSDGKTYVLGTAGTVGPFNAAPYTCGGGASFPQLCNYKRHLYMEEIRVINPSGRREAP